MRFEDPMPQMTRQLELPWMTEGEARRKSRSEEGPTAAQGTERLGASDLMEAMLERRNLQAALKRVKKNRGGPGIDGMTVDELAPHLREHWVRYREQLLGGTYRPRAVKRQLIPKSGGGMRQLGIPTVLDRFIQQALLQVLSPRLDTSFSEHSHGFRPGRSAHGAIHQAQRLVSEGRHWVVDVDLEQFFDRVNHDVLMGKLAKRVGDGRVLGLIRRYLEVGIMAHGVAVERHEGTPQGGPLSPLLANVLLDEVDKELERRGHAFVRYADDCNVYVRSRRAGERVMRFLRRLYGRLRLRVNETKSAVAPVWGRSFLSFVLWRRHDGRVLRAVHRKAERAMKQRVRAITSRTRGRSVPTVIGELRAYLTGWKNYFRLADTPRVFRFLDAWIRRRLRALQLKQWRHGPTIYRELRKRGLPIEAAARAAANAKGWWRNSTGLVCIALPNSYYDASGLPRLAA